MFPDNLGQFLSTMKIYSPKTSENYLPLIVLDGKLKLDFFLQVKKPFGLLIRVPFLLVRWGSA
jgi:hypothetical protein